MFSVKKTLKKAANTVDLKIHNLGKSSRSIIEQQIVTTVQLDAGYKDGTSTIFLGDLRSHATEKDGTDMVTRLACGDGEKAIQTSRVNLSMRKGSTTAQVLQSLAAALGVGPGNLAQALPKLAPFGDMFSLGTVLSGSAAREMTRVLSSVGFTWSIQNGALQILALKTALAGTALLLNAKTGLIGSPSVDKDGVLSCKCLMIPDVFPGRLMVLDGKRLQGQYRIEETTHAGDTHGTDWGIDIKAKRY